MGSSGDILVGSVEPPALNRRLADPRPSRASNSVVPVFLERAGGQDARAPRQARCPRTQAGETPAHSGGRDARAPPGSRRRDACSVCPGYARLRRACQRGCASSAQAGSDARASSRLTQAQRPRPADTSRGQDARAPRQARCPRTQAGETPAHSGGRDARAPRRAARPRPQADGTPAHPGRSCLNLQPRSPRFSSRRSSQAHSSSVRRTSSAARLAANSSGVRHPTSA